MGTMPDRECSRLNRKLLSFFVKVVIVTGALKMMHVWGGQVEGVLYARERGNPTSKLLSLSNSRKCDPKKVPSRGSAIPRN